MTDLTIELIYEKTCPNIAAARTQLLHAFSQLGQTPKWSEWEVSEEGTPDHIHGYGSPTILVNGIDVTGANADTDDMCCRVYANSETKNKGVPTVNDIVNTILNLN